MKNVKHSRKKLTIRRMRGGVAVQTAVKAGRNRQKELLTLT